MSRRSKPKSERGRATNGPPAAQDSGVLADERLTIEQALAQANAYWTAGRPDIAEYLCRQVLAVSSRQPDALHLTGLILHARGDLEAAIDYLRRACQWPESSSIHLSNFAELCRRKGLLAEGEAAARRAVTADADSIAAWNNLGIILQEAGKLADSVECLQQVALRAPDNPEVHNNLGNTFRRLEQLEPADRSYAHALALRPDYPDALSNRADLLRLLGRLDEAAALTRQAIELSPQLHSAYLNAAAIEMARHRPIDALRWLDALLAFAPDAAPALAARAGALLALNLAAEALAVADRAVVRGPNDPAAVMIWLRCLAALGRGEEALAVLDAVGDPSLDMQLLRSALLLEVGRIEAAGALLDDLVDRAPRSGFGWLMRGETRRYAAGDPDLARMEELCGAAGPEAQADRIALTFALGKAWLEAGEPARAFKRLSEANRAKRATFDYDPAAADQWMADIAEAFPAEKLASPAELRRAADLPVFVVGMPRSGTTLVEQVLASHDRVEGAGELSVLERAIGQIGGVMAVPNAPAEQVAALGQHYLSAVSPLAGDAARLVDKMPLNFLYAGVVAMALPGARIIHVRRDPVDTCLSCYTKLFDAPQAFAYDLTELGRFHRAYDRLMGHWRTALPAGTMLEVDYEALVDDLDTQARRMLDFCGLDWQPGVLDFHLTPRVIRSASLTQVRRPLHREGVGRWRPYAAWLQPLLDVLGPVT
ncbi:MAG: sulfotransferase [Alphaproteobacteria bacterium]|nr:sulfotransferase [Alphaproteobacteria bacterium]MBU1516625.1 sulfotransferase [Alphaproteobacteria bacterium]MBU2094381.1 sulfotransferase [Alphaproteobacteria bacterium]MBU2153266.1 sulfotransferase [Alphaproteobacteria bacterium]MBU2307552.1 sulfotransferase [Alphaproteobacteria bacterium]